MKRGDTEVVTCPVIVLYSMRSTLHFFSPFHPLLGPLLHACNECEALWMPRWLVSLSKITPFVSSSRRPPTNYSMWLFVGICSMLLSVEGQMRGSLVTKGRAALRMKLIILEEPIQSVIPSDSCWDVEKYRSIQMTTNYFVLLNNALFFWRDCFWEAVFNDSQGTSSLCEQSLLFGFDLQKHFMLSLCSQMSA